MSEHLRDGHDDLHVAVPATPHGGFHIFVESNEGVVLVRLAGELDMCSAPRFGQALNSALDSRPSTIALDLTELAFLDSTGLRVLLAGQRRAAGQGCDFVLRFPTRSVRRVLQLTGVDRLMAIESDLQSSDSAAGADVGRPTS